MSGLYCTKTRGPKFGSISEAGSQAIAPLIIVNKLSDLMVCPSVKASLLNNSDNFSLSPIGQTSYIILPLSLNHSFHSSLSLL